MIAGNIEKIVILGALLLVVGPIIIPIAFKRGKQIEEITKKEVNDWNENHGKDQ